MEIVPTSSRKKKEIGMDLLLTRKADLKQELIEQKLLISSKTQRLLSTSSLTGYLFQSFTKGLNIMDAVMIGYKMFKSIRTLFRKFK